ncbi:hypothetical protein ACJ73_09414, partial [Blastomyces percursus]
MSTSRRSSEGSDGSSVDGSTDPALHASSHVYHDAKHQQKFSGLADQKHAAEQREEQRREGSRPENHSFVYRKPGAGNLLKEFLG